VNNEFSFEISIKVRIKNIIACRIGVKVLEIISVVVCKQQISDIQYLMFWIKKEIFLLKFLPSKIFFAKIQEIE
jgi:hypothetical protein